MPALSLPTISPLTSSQCCGSSSRKSRFASPSLQLNIANPATGLQKVFEIDDDKRL